MPEDVLRLTTRVYRSHPLFDVLEGKNRGGQIILDFATSWYAYQLGQQRELPAAVAEAQKSAPSSQQSQEPATPKIDVRLLDDALT